MKKGATPNGAAPSNAMQPAARAEGPGQAVVYWKSALNVSDVNRGAPR
jgi:hypothetical protein